MPAFMRSEAWRTWVENGIISSPADGDYGEELHARDRSFIVSARMYRDFSNDMDCYHLQVMKVGTRAATEYPLMWQNGRRGRPVAISATLGQMK